MAVEHRAGLCRVALKSALKSALASAMAWALLAPGLATAQSPPAAVPETRQMIDALKPAANRGMRNLLVRQAPELAGSAPAAGNTVGVVAAPTPTPTPVPVPVPAPLPSPTAAPTAPLTPVAAPTTPPATPASPPAVQVAAPEPAPGPAPSLSLAIQFDLNSARVRPESGAVLGNLVAALLSPDLKANRFVIEGHTDGRGVPAANLRLSQQRADEVRLYLVALGVHPARLKAVGKGSSEPANAKDPLSADNRRVRVVTVE